MGAASDNLGACSQLRRILAAFLADGISAAVDQRVAAGSWSI
jgi:hypothetical protein